MKRHSVYRAWAPEGDVWRPWVKPVLFAALEDEVTAGPLRELPVWLGARLVDPLVAATPARRDENPYRDAAGLRDTAIVVDLPAATGARLGVALGAHGFRPIPLYNALPAFVNVPAMVDVHPIMNVLVQGVPHVKHLPHGLPPAFLLDANRMAPGRSPQAGAFDNRSVCRATDFPSPDVLLAQGIRRVVLVRDHPATDLDDVVVVWQKRGIALWAMSGSGETDARPHALRERSWFSRLIDDARRAFLPRREDGSFGLTVPHAG